MRIPVDRAALPKLALCLLLAVLLLVLHPPAAWAPVLLAGLVAAFFRDPERPAQAGPGELLSPADGRVMAVEDVARAPVLGEPARVITIFLGLTDVHMNRVPITGVIEHINYQPGKYLAAFAPKASEVNERNHVVIRGDGLRVMVVQIAGFVARRIVCRVRAGQAVTAGQRLGLIQFGSATQLFLPPDAEVLVRPGQRVKGALTVLARDAAAGRAHPLSDTQSMPARTGA